MTVPNVPVDDRDALKARAARLGMTLDAYLRSVLIGLARRPDNAALMARVEERVRRMGTRIDPREVLELMAPERR